MVEFGCVELSFRTLPGNNKNFTYRDPSQSNEAKVLSVIDTYTSISATHLSPFVVNHDISGFDISMYYTMSVYEIKALNLEVSSEYPFAFADTP